MSKEVFRMVEDSDCHFSSYHEIKSEHYIMITRNNKQIHDFFYDSKSNNTLNNLLFIHTFAFTK